MADKRESYLKTLETIRQELHEKFPTELARLAQLDAHIATTSMVIEHIHDEAARAAQGG